MELHASPTRSGDYLSTISVRRLAQPEHKVKPSDAIMSGEFNPRPFPRRTVKMGTAYLLGAAASLDLQKSKDQNAG